MNEPIPYKPDNTLLARELRNNSTKGEIILWEKLKKRQVEGYKFIRQKCIKSFIVDFYCHELRLAVEVDGSSHDDKQDYDAERQLIIEEFDVKFLRFTEEEVRKDAEKVVEIIADWITNNR